MEKKGTLALYLNDICFAGRVEPSNLATADIIHHIRHIDVAWPWRTGRLLWIGFVTSICSSRLSPHCHQPNISGCLRCRKLFMNARLRRAYAMSRRRDINCECSKPWWLPLKIA